MDQQIADQHAKIAAEANGLGDILQGAMDGVHIMPVHIPVVFDVPDTLGGEAPEANQSYHTGGMVRKYHTGTGNVLPFIGKAHRGLAADEVTAILLTGESVLNRRATANVGNDTVRALNNGAQLDRTSEPSGSAALPFAAMLEAIARIEQRQGHTEYYLTNQLRRDLANANYEVFQRAVNR